MKDAQARGCRLAEQLPTDRACSGFATTGMSAPHLKAVHARFAECQIAEPRCTPLATRGWMREESCSYNRWSPRGRRFTRRPGSMPQWGGRLPKRSGGLEHIGVVAYDSFGHQIAMNTSKRTSEWLVCRRPRESAVERLFCLPYAGGGPAAFNAWWAEMPACVEMLVAHLPGREARYKEPALSDLDSMVGHLADAFDAQLDKPYAIFGYSMGALLGFEVVRELRRRRAPLPRLLIVGAKSAPQLPARTPALAHLPREELIEGVRRFYQPPEAAWAIKDLVDLILPALRADLAICDGYHYQAEAPLDCPVLALCGDEDRSVLESDVAGWREQTSAGFELLTYPGSHFFINDHLADILARVVAALRGQRPAVGP